MAVVPPAERTRRRHCYVQSVFVCLPGASLRRCACFSVGVSTAGLRRNTLTDSRKRPMITVLSRTEIKKITSKSYLVCNRSPNNITSVRSSAVASTIWHAFPRALFHPLTIVFGRSSMVIMPFVHVITSHSLHAQVENKIQPYMPVRLFELRLLKG